MSQTDTGEAVTQLLTPAQLKSRFTEVRLGPSSMLYYTYGTTLNGPSHTYSGYSNLQAGIPLGLGGDQHAETPEQLLVAMRLTLQYSTRTSHPLFFNQLYGGPEPAGIAGVAGLSLSVPQNICRLHELARVLLTKPEPTAQGGHEPASEEWLLYLLCDSHLCCVHGC